MNDLMSRESQGQHVDCVNSRSESKLSSAASTVILFARLQRMPIHGAGNFFRNCRARLTLHGSTMKANIDTSNEKVSSKIEVAFARLLLAILKTAVLVIAMIATAQADEPRDRHEHNHNYIIERQQAGSVNSGDVPIVRRIRGSREIDVYSDGSMFEGNNYVGKDRR